MIAAPDSPEIHGALTPLPDIVSPSAEDDDDSRVLTRSLTNHPNGSGHVLAHQRVDHESIFGPRAWLTTGHLSLDQPHDGRPDFRRGHGSPDRDHYP